MGTLHISDADLARDPYAVLAKVEEGVEVIVERDHRPVATIKSPKRSGRPISECIASAKGQRLEGDLGWRLRQGCRGRDWRAQPAMESPLLGLILDSSVIIAAERKREGERQIRPHAGWQMDHARKASSTARNVDASTPTPMCRRSPVVNSNSTSASADLSRRTPRLSTKANRTDWLSRSRLRQA